VAAIDTDTTAAHKLSKHCTYACYLASLSARLVNMGNYNLIIPINIKPQPDKYEKVVAQLCAQKFQSDILFVKPTISTTPDIQVVRTKQFWEIKNIQGDGKNTIEDNLKRASRQADNVIISLLRSKMAPQKAEMHIRYYLKHARKNLKKVILVTKERKIVDFRANS